MRHDHPYNDLLARAMELAMQAGDAIMPLYESGDFTTTSKVDDSPLTQADLRSNEIIIDGLQRLKPTIPIVSEEALIPAEERLASEHVWMVDPIDGTKEFIKKNGQFTINIGLIKDGKPVLGVVYAPALQLWYYGGEGLGAWRKEAESEPKAIRVKEEKRPLVAVGSLSHPSDVATAWLDKHAVHETIAVGSSLKVCYVADGTADVYPRPDVHLHEWDIAAADAVLRAAGGRCQVFETGEVVTYNKPDLRMPHFLISGPNFR